MPPISAEFCNKVVSASENNKANTTHCGERVGILLIDCGDGGDAVIYERLSDPLEVIDTVRMFRETDPITKEITTTTTEDGKRSEIKIPVTFKSQ